MIWASGALVLGLPLGLLVGWAMPTEAGLAWRVFTAVCVAASPLIAATVCHRIWGVREERLVLANGAVLSVMGLGAAAWLEWAPGPLFWAFAAFVWAVAGLIVEAQREEHASGSEFARVFVWHGLLPIPFALLLASVAADALAPEAAPTPARSSAIYDFDAAVAALARPDCVQRVLRSEVLPARGAHPRVAHEDGAVWFDAEVDGRRQIHRLDPGSGALTCFTCREEGNNRRPDVAPGGVVVVFDTDRWAGDGKSGTELHRISGKEPNESQRLTRQPGADERAVLGPSPRVVAWSRVANGRSVIASASVLTGHGGVLLGAPGALSVGGSAWVTPLAWGTDARALVLARGNPVGDLAAVATDPATGREWPLAFEVARGPAGLSGDGGWLALTTGERMRNTGVLPESLGFALVPMLGGEERAPLLRRTRLLTGPIEGPLRSVALGEIESWGEPTGVALDASGTRAVLGQRRFGGDGPPAERLLALTLACDEP